MKACCVPPSELQYTSLLFAVLQRTTAFRFEPQRSVVRAPVTSVYCFASAVNTVLTPYTVRLHLQAALKKGTGGWKKVVATFGRDILQENGEVDRARLGQIVFADASKRQLLNRTLAPYIGFGIYWEIAKLWLRGSRVIVLDVPLLFEAKMNWLTKPVIVVWVDPETQLQRLVVRDGISEEQALNKIHSQFPLDSKRERADIVIDNSGSLEATKEQIHDISRQITGPLTCKEYLRSRNGVLSILGAVIVMILGCTKR